MKKHSINDQIDSDDDFEMDKEEFDDTFVDLERS
jgi:hypothetical protein